MVSSKLSFPIDDPEHPGGAVLGACWRSEYNQRARDATAHFLSRTWPLVSVPFGPRASGNPNQGEEIGPWSKDEHASRLPTASLEGISGKLPVWQRRSARVIAMRSTSSSPRWAKAASRSTSTVGKSTIERSRRRAPEPPAISGRWLTSHKRSGPSFSPCSRAPLPVAPSTPSENQA